MTNNDILRRLRYSFNLSDSKMIATFALVDCPVDRSEISDWLKKDQDPNYKSCSDIYLAAFLNGFIVDKRGKREGPQPAPEKRLNNNIILRKLKIALNLKNEEIVQIMTLAGLSMSKHELSAFFRTPTHKNYRSCRDQILRNFLQGLQKQFRPNQQPEIEFKWK